MTLSFSTSPPSQPWLSATTVQIAWTIVQGVGTLVLGVLGVLIARQNAKISERSIAVTEQKSRLDQFDRRYAVFQATENLFYKVQANAKLTTEEIVAYRQAVADVPFLFYEDVSEYVRGLINDAWELAKLTDEHDPLPPGPEKKAFFDKKWELIRTMYRKGDRSVAIFQPYLDMRPVQRPKPTEGNIEGVRPIAVWGE